MNFPFAHITNSTLPKLNTIQTTTSCKSYMYFITVSSNWSNTIAYGTAIHVVCLTVWNWFMQMCRTVSKSIRTAWHIFVLISNICCMIMDLAFIVNCQILLNYYPYFCRKTKLILNKLWLYDIQYKILQIEYLMTYCFERVQRTMALCVLDRLCAWKTFTMGMEEAYWALGFQFTQTSWFLLIIYDMPLKR